MNAEGSERPGRLIVGRIVLKEDGISGMFNGGRTQAMFSRN